MARCVFKQIRFAQRQSMCKNEKRALYESFPPRNRVCKLPETRRCFTLFLEATRGGEFNFEQRDKSVLGPGGVARLLLLPLLLRLHRPRSLKLVKTFGISTDFGLHFTLLSVHFQFLCSPPLSTLRSTSTHAPHTPSNPIIRAVIAQDLV